ncbi:hypothetical protein KKB10_03560 [Patescibacteria group bacterium]|nr:hypothetical protein [Patescibacteria group bacterium]MBU1951907.1 hypothetical protein [Patescibacteria group bacterium]MBU2236135.1 hypothetical protein [Patescibacteria group bacterium]
MAENSSYSNNLSKRIRLIARIWSAPIIIYALLMLIGYGVDWITIGTADPYTVENYPFIENVPPILMFLAIVGLAIAWRFEKIGAGTNLLFCALTLIIFPFTIDTLEFRSMVPVVLMIIIAIPGVLFLIHWRRER